MGKPVPVEEKGRLGFRQEADALLRISGAGVLWAPVSAESESCLLA